MILKALYLKHCHELDSLDIVVGDEELKKDIMDRIRKATDEVYMTKFNKPAS